MGLDDRTLSSTQERANTASGTKGGSRQLAAVDPPFEKVNLLRGPRTVARHGAAPESLEDAIGVVADISVGPKVEMHPHRLAVFLAKQRLDFDFKSDRFIVLRQRILLS